MVAVLPSPASPASSAIAVPASRAPRAELEPRPCDPDSDPLACEPAEVDAPPCEPELADEPVEPASLPVDPDAPAEPEPLPVEPIEPEPLPVEPIEPELEPPPASTARATHWFAEHTSDALHVPQLMLPPQPSEAVPQLSPAGHALRGVHPHWFGLLGVPPPQV